MKVFFIEDFASVDPGLTPDPFNSVTVGSGNTAVADPTNGYGGSQGMKITFGGTTNHAYGARIFSAGAKLGNGPLIAQFKANVVNSGQGSGAKLSIQSFKNFSASNELLRIQWETQAVTTTGKFSLYCTIDNTTTVGSNTFNINTWYTIKVVMKKKTIKVYINGVLEINYTLTNTLEDVGRVQVGSAYQSSIPNSSGKVYYDDVDIKQDLLVGGSLNFMAPNDMFILAGPE